MELCIAILYQSIPSLQELQYSHFRKHLAWLDSNPGPPRPDFISCSRGEKSLFVFLQGCEIKSGRGRPGFEAILLALLLQGRVTSWHTPFAQHHCYPQSAIATSFQSFQVYYGSYYGSIELSNELLYVGRSAKGRLCYLETSLWA